MLLAEVSEGDADGTVSFGKLSEALMDGVGEDGPEVFVGGGVERVGGDEEHFVILGQSFNAFLLQGQSLGLASCGEDGVGELDPMKVEVQVSDGKGFVIDVGVEFRSRLHISLRV